MIHETSTLLQIEPFTSESSEKRRENYLVSVAMSREFKARDSDEVESLFSKPWSSEESLHKHYWGAVTTDDYKGKKTIKFETLTSKASKSGPSKAWAFIESSLNKKIDLKNKLYRENYIQNLRDLHKRNQSIFKRSFEVERLESLLGKSFLNFMDGQTPGTPPLPKAIVEVVPSTSSIPKGNRPPPPAPPLYPPPPPPKPANN